MGGWAWTATALLLAGCGAGRVEVRELLAPVEPGVFEGRVVDDLGNPVAEARVSICGPPKDSLFGPAYPGLAETLTSDDGRFVMTGVPPGPCFVSVDAPDRVPIQFLPMTAPARGIDLASPRWGRVRFRLVPPDGEAPPDLADLCIPSCPRYRPRFPAREPAGGVFEGGDFAPGTQGLVIVARGWAPVTATFDAVPGRTVDVGDLLLDRGHALRGLVVDGEGAPLAGARVSSSGYWTSAYEAETDAAGEFRIDHLPAGEEYFWASADGYGSRRLPLVIPAGGGEVRIELSRGGILHVFVRMKGCGAPYSCTIRVVDSDDPDSGAGDIHGQTDGDGMFDMSLPAGRYRVEHLCGGEGDPPFREVVLPVAAERTVEFVEEVE